MNIEELYDGVFKAGLDAGLTVEKAATYATKAVKSAKLDTLRTVQKGLTSLIVRKGGKPIGATSERKDGTYKKVGQGQWEKVADQKESSNKQNEQKEKITSLNPTGGIFVNHKPEDIMNMDLGKNITTLAETAGYDPDEKITVYRGVSTGKGTIGPGDFITTNKQLAQDYAGTGTVISSTIRAGDILDDSTEPLGEEYIYYPKEKSHE